MTVISSGLYKISLKQVYVGQISYNVFWYVDTLGRDDIQEEAALAFDQDVLSVTSFYQNPAVTYQEIISDNVTGNLAPYSLVPSITAGQRAGSNSPSFLALGVRLNRTTKDTRNGQKRFTGQVEEDQTGNFWGAGYTAIFDQLETVLAAQISTVGGVFDPYIIRVPTAASPFYIGNPIASATASLVVTTQNSRKFGVGQ